MGRALLSRSETFKTRSCLFSLLVAAIASASFFLGNLASVDGSPAHAHDGAEYFEVTWPTSPLWYRANISGLGVGNGQFAQATINSAAQWNNVPNNIGADSPNIHHGGSVGSSVGGCLSVYAGRIYLGSSGSLDPEDLGVTHRCTTGGDTITRVSVRFNTNSPFVIGAQPNHYDLRSVITHELGHAMGWKGEFGHPCGQVIHTMCYYAESNSISQRTLENHDKHTFDDGYS